MLLLAWVRPFSYIFVPCLYLCSDNLLDDYPLAGLKRQMRVLHQ